MSKTKILIVCSFGESLMNFRGDFIKALVEENFEVFCAAPYIKSATRKMLEEWGAHYDNFPLQRTGMNPLKDIGSIRVLGQLMDKHEIDIVFPYTIKPVIYSSIAAGKRKIPVVSLITGLGFTFSAISPKAKLLQNVTQIMYRYALKFNQTVIFQNIDDQALFKEKNIINGKSKSYVVNGSGINLNKYKFRERKIAENSKVKFVLAGRLMPEKGVGLFIKAAETLKSNNIQAEFHLFGSVAKQYESSPFEKELNRLAANKTVILHGHVDNVAVKLDEMDVFVLPTYYREGVPRSILEALSSGMPVITTNTPGCRETVIPDKNGFLLPPQELDPLIEAMQFFIENPSRIPEMGKNSFHLAKEKFDVHLINKQLISLIRESI
ncbi:glycosyltransferase family 4 protein [Zeaxanthinibacter enoshimensis]|uniref:Glycosyltransferase involved in cell wall biosynthesis n=1 Tax=Zeaxanthinibacter enoshimensis TaxID=392009 RepID=A0A4V3D3U0_9FLAO|nr:glycosyltransferase family 4 protein [Zeaxanthinibacter enoshimensis]TDQ31163.1 glycosyltransferase involved in cell wall biosynthesis [Zeaxanthinibacter enoshimensis]